MDLNSFSRLFEKYFTYLGSKIDALTVETGAPAGPGNAISDVYGFLTSTGEGTLLNAISDIQTAIEDSGGVALSADYKSPDDFTVTRTASDTLTLSGLTFTPISSQIAYVKRVGATDSSIFVNGAGGVTLNYTAGTIVGSGVSFGVSDVFEVGINSQVKGYDLTTNSNMFTNIAPDSQKYVQDSLVDTTNVAAGTTYYPSSDSTGLMDGYRSFSLSGKLVDANGTITVSVLASNEEDSTSVLSDAVTIYGYDTANNTLVNSISVTSDTKYFNWHFDDLNNSNVIVKLVTSTSDNTITLKSRRVW